MNILLTGTRAPVALDLARAFAACGHTVHGVDSLRSAVTGGMLASFTLCASPRRTPDAFAGDAEAVVDRLRPDLIVPLCEEVFYWAQLAGPKGWPLFAPDLATLMRLHSKFAFVELARSLGLDAPETKRLQGDSVIQNTDRSVFKPEFSRFGARLMIRPDRPPSDHDPANPWLQQAYIPGEDVCLYAIARNGRLRAFSAYRSAWRTRGRASYYFEPITGDLNQQLMNIASRITGALRLTGQIACDLRLDNDGRPWLIECNPRATSGLHLLAHDPQALVAAFVDDDGDLLEAAPQPACVGPAMIVSGLPRALRQRRLRHWQADLSRARDVMTGVRWRAFAGAIGLMARAALAGQDLQTFLTADMECNRDLTCS